MAQTGAQNIQGTDSLGVDEQLPRAFAGNFMRFEIGVRPAAQRDVVVMLEKHYSRMPITTSCKTSTVKPTIFRLPF